MRKLGLTSWTLIGLGLGIVVGLFFGEYAKVLQPIGDAFVMLLQMAVLPYFVVTLILGLGSITLTEAKLLGVNGIKVLAMLWGVCLLMVFLLPLTFPALEAAAFFSTSDVQPPEQLDFLGLYIPSNPFRTLADGILPGIVMFGIALGVALISVPRKDSLLEALASLQQALVSIVGFVVKLTPVGVFALAAGAAGTMSIEELSRLQVYLIAYTVGAMLLAFWIVPMLISTLTPFTYREVFRAARDPLVTGFTTGNLLVVLPMLTENIKTLFHERQLGNEDTDSMVGVVVPISYPFPDIGTLLIMLFVPFAAWFSGSPMALDEYPKFAVVGFFSFFGNVEIGMPFLLDQLRLPSDMFELYLMTLVYIGRFATLVAVTHVAAMTLMTVSAANGLMRLDMRRFGTYAAGSAGIVLTALLALTIGLKAIVSDTYEGDQLVTSMQWRGDPLPAAVEREVPDRGLPRPPEGTSLLDQIRERGMLRVGYINDALPYTFFNRNDELVGFDVEMAGELASDLGVKLEFVPYSRQTLLQQLEAGHFDIAMGGRDATPTLAAEALLSESYLDINLGIVVEDFRRKKFDTVEKIRNNPTLRLGVLDNDYLGPHLKQVFPQAEIVPLVNPPEFFEGGFLQVDGLVISVQAGSAWTLLYPEFTAVAPQPVRGTIPLAYVIAWHDSELKAYLDSWIDLKKGDGTIERLYNHWVLGEDAGKGEPRWSILRNVLGWVD
jgi:Na+/H+-dicarboxylate symporter/ABC-type amino acid transport substrate-binding protein